MSDKIQKVGRVEAMHIVALSIEANRLRSLKNPDLERAKDLEDMSDKLVQEWKKQLWQVGTCPKCGKELDL